MLPFREITHQHSILNNRAQEFPEMGLLLKPVFHADSRNRRPCQDRWFKPCGKAVNNSTNLLKLGLGLGR